MKYLKVLLPFLMLAHSGCAIYTYDQMVFSQLRTGGLGYNATKMEGEYVIEIWEHKHTSDDLHNYETHTPELREKAALILLKEKEQCKSIDVIHEEPFDYQGPPTWSHGHMVTWSHGHMADGGEC